MWAAKGHRSLCLSFSPGAQPPRATRRDWEGGASAEANKAVIDSVSPSRQRRHRPSCLEATRPSYQINKQGPSCQADGQLCISALAWDAACPAAQRKGTDGLSKLEEESAARPTTGSTGRGRSWAAGSTVTRGTGGSDHVRRNRGHQGPRQVLQLVTHLIVEALYYMSTKGPGTFSLKSRCNYLQ